MTTTETNSMTVATIIAQQIGARAFYMMGTRYKLADKETLIFDVRGSKANKVRVTLDASDTYTVEALKVPTTARQIVAGKQPVTLYSQAGIYADGLNQAIEAATGLRLSL